MFKQRFDNEEFVEDLYQQQQSDNEEQKDEDEYDMDINRQIDEENQNPYQKVVEDCEQVPGSLLKKVASSKKAMREFFVESEQLYLPPDRDLTSKFCRQVLSGEKDLIHIGAINRTIGVPNDSEIRTQILWNKVKNDEEITRFLPDYSEKKIPNRQFLIDIINTIYPGVMNKIVLELRKQKVKAREAKLKKYVLVKKSFAKKLKSFISKRKNDVQKPGRFVGLMQEDRKKDNQPRQKHANVAFDFNFEEIVKKVKFD